MGHGKWMAWSLGRRLSFMKRFLFLNVHVCDLDVVCLLGHLQLARRVGTCLEDDEGDNSLSKPNARNED